MSIKIYIYVLESNCYHHFKNTLPSISFKIELWSNENELLQVSYEIRFLFQLNTQYFTWNNLRKRNEIIIKLSISFGIWACSIIFKRFGVLLLLNQILCCFTNNTRFLYVSIFTSLQVNHEYYPVWSKQE